ncbi:MAG: NAD(P)/FAD-dependent oxidoreductase [Spirochaetota bacterium]
MKVSVFGAGPAGSTAAYFLAKNGAEVELIDTVDFPREKPCAGGLFNPQQYEREFPYLKQVQGKYIYRVRFYCGQHSSEYASRIPLLNVFQRKDLDYFLYRMALAQGAVFYRGKKPEGAVIIDATGARNPGRYPRAGICLCCDFETDHDVDTVHIHYAFGGIKGYCWVYPKQGYVNIGVGAYLPQKNIREIYYRYIDYVNESGIVSVAGKQYRASIIPFSPIRKFYHNNTLVAGDAAGMVNPSTGEGIYFAMLSGKLAARTILEKKPFPWYQKQCMESFGEYLKPTLTGRTGKLLNRVLEKAIKFSTRDELFKKMLAENFFRLNSHRVGSRFIWSILQYYLTGRKECKPD